MSTLKYGHRRRSLLLSRDSLAELEIAATLARHRGADLYVDSNASGGATGSSWTDAYLTVQAAIDAAAAGDRIHVNEGHAETLADATTLTPNVAGIEIIGYGRGARRPTFTFTAAGSNIPVSAAGVRISNLLCVPSGTVDVTSAVTVTGADVELLDLEFRDSAATSQFVAAITLGTGAARAYILRPIGRSHASGDAANAGVTCAVAIDGVIIVDADFDGLYALGCIYNVTNAMTNLTVDGGQLRNRHATQDGCINVVATTTGFILSPRCRTATNDADGFNLAIVAADMQVYDALVVNLDGETGGAWGTASAAS